MQHHHQFNEGKAGGSSPRGLTPRLPLGEVANLTNWELRQGAIREMLGSARSKVQTQTEANKQATPRPATAPPRREMPHERVWREAAERQAAMRARMQAREAERHERAQAAREAAEREAAVAYQARQPSEHMRSQMVKSQRKLQEWFCDDRKRFRRVFRAMDDDHNGWVDRDELRTLPVRTNLTYFVSPPVLEALIDLMDIDGDGRILYHEFVRIIMAEDVFHP